MSKTNYTKQFKLDTASLVIEREEQETFKGQKYTFLESPCNSTGKWCEHVILEY